MLRMIALLLCASLVGACQTDRGSIAVGPWERITPPAGMFPETVGKRDWAAGKVGYNFQSNKDGMAADPVLTLRVLTDFEWLCNDLRNENDVPPYQLKKLFVARDDLREVVNVPTGTNSQDAIEQYWAMAKFLDLARQQQAPESESVAQRRKFLQKAKARVDSVLKQILETQQPPRPAPQPTGT